MVRQDENLEAINALREAVEELAAQRDKTRHEFELFINRPRLIEIATEVTNMALEMQDDANGVEHVPVSSVI